MLTVRCLFKTRRLLEEIWYIFWWFVFGLWQTVLPPNPTQFHPLRFTPTHSHLLTPIAIHSHPLINSLSFLPTPNYFHQPFSSLFSSILPRSIFKIWEATIFKEHLSVVICENRKNSRNFFKTQILQSSVVLKDNCSKLEVKIFENICK